LISLSARFARGFLVPKIFKIIDAALYENANRAGWFHGVEIDLKDGYIHFSAAAEAVETEKLHFAARQNLMLMACDAEAFGDSLKWEPSRGGHLFPHLFAPLDMKKVLWARPLPWNGAAHDFPAETFA